MYALKSLLKLATSDHPKTTYAKCLFANYWFKKNEEEQKKLFSDDRVFAFFVRQVKTLDLPQEEIKIKELSEKSLEKNDLDTAFQRKFHSYNSLRLEDFKQSPGNQNRRRLRENCN